MKKILLVLNGTLTPPHVIDAAIKFARLSPSLLHTVFIDYELDLAEYNYAFPNDLSLTRNSLTGKTIAEENASLIESNIQLFKDECETAKVNFFIETSTEITLGDLINYSIFSDLILADANEDLGEHQINDLFVKAQCPVYLVSRNIADTENIILTYDGSVSNMFAIKQYCYLFPEFRDLPTHLVHINPTTNNVLPQEENIKMWLTSHFPNIQIKFLHGNISEELVKYVKSVPNSITVMGAFGKSFITRIFHKSPAKNVIEEAKSSVFITH